MIMVEGWLNVVGFWFSGVLAGVCITLLVENIRKARKERDD